MITTATSSRGSSQISTYFSLQPHGARRDVEKPGARLLHEQDADYAEQGGSLLGRQQ
jgi:hypothetical protein